VRDEALGKEDVEGAKARVEGREYAEDAADVAGVLKVAREETAVS
jgi:hypothetical protein